MAREGVVQVCRRGSWQFTQDELVELDAIAAPGVRVRMASAHPIDKAINLR